MKFITAVSILIASIALSSSAFSQEDGLAIKATIQLSSAADGFNGRLVLLEDKRLTPDLDKLLWESGGPELALNPTDPRYKLLTSPPLQPAKIRLLNDSSNPVAEMKLERELARIEPVPLHPGHRTILVTTDLSAGFGSYSGPFTELLDLRQGKFETVTAQNTESSDQQPIRLASTLKTAWKLSPAGNHSNAAEDILEVACRPNADASAFYITYSRYHWTSHGWIESSRSARGWWEADEAFPPSAAFPNPPPDR